VRDILLWVAAVELTGVAALPLLRAFFGNRRDAALLCRPLGLALIAYIAWVLSLLGLPFERGVLVIALVVVGITAWLVHRRTRERFPAPFWASDEKRGAILFWASAAVFLAIRAAWPEILGQEKFMDLAFLNSLTHNTNMPPLDPWMSGKTINYYYWGYLLAAAATRLSGISTLVSYNLAIATFAGYSFVAAACLGLRLSKGRLPAGIAAGVATVFAGNLAGALDGWNYFLGRGFNYFHASRVIDPENTINEFPFFTFFQADLHPHLLAFPYFLAAFAVGHRFLEAGVPSTQGTTKPEPWFVSHLDALPFYLLAGAALFSIPFNLVTAAAIALISYFAIGQQRRGWLGRFLPMLLLVLTAGTAMAANKWSQPALGILLLVVCVLRHEQGRALPSLGRALSGAALAVVLFAVAINLWRPYWLSFRLPEAHVLRVTLTSGLLEFLSVWGILFAVALAAVSPHNAARDEAERRRRDLALATAVATSLLVALLLKAPAVFVLVLLLLLAANVAWQALGKSHDGEEASAAFLLVLGLAMVAGCEFVYFKDNYGERLQRMNTIFKFYNQAWPLIAVSVAVFAERLWRETEGRLRRRALATLLAACAVAALLYPAAAIIQRLRQHEGPVTLDARVALTRRNPGDAAAIAWLGKSARPGAVLIEATGDPYSEYARVSSHTGIPTVLGWANHEGLWRENDKEVQQRLDAVRSFYSASNPSLALSVLQRYRVNYVVVGDMERQTSPSASAAESYPFLEPVLSGSTTVYRVIGTQ
jgi:uncharacterized membrane protein